MTIQALTVSVETSFNTVNAEAGPDTLPSNIQAFPPISIEIKDTSSRLNNPLDAIINNKEIQINQGVWNNLNVNVPQFHNKINIIDGRDTTLLAKYPPKAIPIENGTWNTGFTTKNADININVGNTTNTLETKITNSKIPIHDANLDLFESNGDTVNTELFISNTTGISSNGPVENGYEWDWLTRNGTTSSGSEPVLNVGTADTSPSGVHFKPDGTVVYFSGWSTDAVYQVSLSTPWDITSNSSLTGITNTSSFGTNVKDFFLKSDGTKLYIAQATKISEYDLSTAWDITTVSSTPVNEETVDRYTATSAGGLYFKPDGSIMYYCDGGDDYFSQYTLTTPWDISTKTDFKSISQSGESAAQAISIKDDGTVLYIVGSTGDGIDYYTLSTPWDITTRSSTAGHFSFSNTAYNPTGFFIKPNGGASFWVTFRTAGAIQNSVTDGIAEFSFSAGGIKIPSTEAISKPPILDYQSTGDITLISKISNTKITSSKSSTLFNSSYGGINNTELKIVDNTDTTIENTLTNKKISIENPPSDSNGSIVTPKNSTGITINPTTKAPLEIPISSRYIGTEADKASLSPSFCNAVQLVIFTSNQTPLGYFERDGHGYFETITPQNDPRIGSGNSGGEGGDDGGGSESSSSGPIQTWSS
jgi:hypothetical protein